MQSGVSAAVTAMEQAVRRLDAALAQRAAAFRSLSDRHSQATAELRALRDELQAAQDEAASLRERAALVDALREELAQIQAERGEGDMQPAGGSGDTARRMQLEQAVAARDIEIAALKDERDDLQLRLASAETAAAALRQIAAQAPQPKAGGDGGTETADLAALKAELAAARAAGAEMQAFQAGIAARLEATMARLRQALDAEAAQ